MEMNYHTRPTVADIRAKKTKGEKISMLFVETLDEARAADAAGIDMLSIIDTLWTPQMRQAAGNCFVQVGLIYGELCTAEDYLRAAHRVMMLGADCIYCAAGLGTVKIMADEGIPVVSHVGLVPSKCTWTGGYKAVGKTAESARAVWDQVQALEAVGCFGAELEVVPDRLGAWITQNTSMIMLGMGAGPGADAQYLFTEDVLGHGQNHKPRHGKTYRNFAAEFARLQDERIAAFKEFIDDVQSGAYPATEHLVPIEDNEFEAFLSQLD
jgi:3-methyl-2-oxobutanoate hydroxymethyltransferase